MYCHRIELGIDKPLCVFYAITPPSYALQTVWISNNTNKRSVISIRKDYASNRDGDRDRERKIDEKYEKRTIGRRYIIRKDHIYYFTCLWYCEWNICWELFPKYCHKHVNAYALGVVWYGKVNRFSLVFYEKRIILNCIITNFRSGL